MVPQPPPFSWEVAGWVSLKPVRLTNQQIQNSDRSPKQCAHQSLDIITIALVTHTDLLNNRWRQTLSSPRPFQTLARDSEAAITVTGMWAHSTNLCICIYIYVYRHMTNVHRLKASMRATSPTLAQDSPTSVCQFGSSAVGAHD